MKRILQTPLLPLGKATVAVSCDAKEIISSLLKYGIEVFEIKKNPKMNGAVSSHADCNLLQLDSKTFICDEEIASNLKATIKKNIVNNLTIGKSDSEINTDIEILTEKIESPYPKEAAINVKRVDNNIVCNKNIVSKTILNYCKINNIDICHCNQGYVGCSSVLVANNAIMTDDKSVYNSFNRIGFDCLMLSKGKIKLNGFSYGFIGGCCGFIDNNLLAFTGKLDSHDDSKKIKEFLKKYKIDYLELSDKSLTDVGGIVPIIEEI